MIPCPKCGADNMVSAIFCRQCHERLNLDEITPEAFDEPDEKKGSTASRLATAIIVVLLLAVLGLTLVPIKMPSSGENLADDKARTTATTKFTLLQSPHPGKSMTFSNDEATHAAMTALGLPRTGDAKMLPTKVSIEFLDGGSVKVVLQQKAFGKVPLCTSVVAVPTVSTPGQMDFAVQKVSVGMLPMFGPLKGKALKPMSDLFGGNFQFTSARGNAASVEISADAGKFVFPK
jgi:hypothetical protein